MSRTRKGGKYKGGGFASQFKQGLAMQSPMFAVAVAGDDSPEDIAEDAVDSADDATNTLDNLDLVSSFNIVSFSNNKIIYRIIYNGPPDKFILDMDRKNLFLNKGQQVWEIQ